MEQGEACHPGASSDERTGRFHPSRSSYLLRVCKSRSSRAIVSARVVGDFLEVADEPGNDRSTPLPFLEEDLVLFRPNEGMSTARNESKRLKFPSLEGQPPASVNRVNSPMISKIR